MDLTPLLGTLQFSWYVAGKSVRDMAADSGTSEKAVESQLSRARKAFRATFVALAGTLSLET